MMRILMATKSAEEYAKSIFVFSGINEVWLFQDEFAEDVIKELRELIAKGKKKDGLHRCRLFNYKKNGIGGTIIWRTR